MIVCGFRIRYFLIMGAWAWPRRPGVAAAPRIPAEPDPGIPESRTGTLWQRLPCDPVHDRHRVRAFAGKGLFAGTQSQLNFLPENHTDFIFAVAGEEFGFIGTTIILLLYGVVIYRGLSIALHASDDFGTCWR